MVIKAILTVDFNVIRKWASKGKEQFAILWDISDTNSGKIIKGCNQPLITVKILRRASTRNEQSATLWDTQDISRFLHSLHLSIFRITKNCSQFHQLNTLESYLEATGKIPNKFIANYFDQTDCRMLLRIDKDTGRERLIRTRLIRSST